MDTRKEKQAEVSKGGLAMVDFSTKSKASFPRDAENLVCYKSMGIAACQVFASFCLQDRSRQSLIG